MTEVWREVPGDRLGLEVSSLGRLRRPATTSAAGSRLKARELAQTIDGEGYVRTSASATCGVVYVHRLIALVFIGPPPTPAHTDVNHKNGIKTDNRWQNLEWATRKQNMQHAVSMGLAPRGEQNGRAKMSAYTAMTVYWHYHVGGATQAALARDFELTRNQVRGLIHGKTWKHVTDKFPEWGYVS